MAEKNVFKEKKEFIFAQFKSKQGLWDFVLISFFFGYFFVNFTFLITGELHKFLVSFIPVGILLDGLVYLIYGMIVTPLSLGLSWIFHLAYMKLFREK